MREALCHLKFSCFYSVLGFGFGSYFYLVSRQVLLGQSEAFVR